MSISQYIDIHTHCDKSKNSDVISVYSVFAQHFNESSIQNNNYFTIGIHPWHADSVDIDDGLQRIEQAGQLSNCIGIGEIGLDRACSALFEKQLSVFEQQLILAKQLSMPIVVHNVRCLFEIMRIVKRLNFQLPIIFHGFTGKVNMAMEIVSKGAYLSFGKFQNTYVHDILRLIPLNQVFFETDESNLTIQEIYEKASVISNISIDIWKEKVYNNFKTVFNNKI